MHKSVLASLEVKADAPEGSVRAAFSVYDVADGSRDVVKAGAFQEGAGVLMSPAHDWTAPPIGKGVIRDRGSYAEFDGQFFLNTAGGREWYESVKAAGDLQQWSFGYEIIDSERGEFKGEAVQFLKKLKVFEVSPVLVGDNQLTHTVAVKHGAAPAETVPAAATKAAAMGSFEQRAERLRVALDEMSSSASDRGYGYGYIVATYSDHIVACMSADDMADYWSIPYTVDADGMPTLGEPTRVEQTFVSPATRAVSYVASIDQALAHLKDVAARSRSLAELRSKEGRMLSEANRTRLAGMVEAMKAVMADVEDLLAATERQQANAVDEAKALGDAMRRAMNAGDTARRLLSGV